MDYGHTTSSGAPAPNQPIFSPQDFFTPGVGDLPADINPDLMQSLNTESSLNWTPDTPPILASPENATISNSASEKSPADESVDRLKKAAELGQIIDLVPPPVSSDQKNPIAAVERSMSFNKTEIKTGDRLSKSGVREVDHILHELDKTGDIASFYATAREMTKTNLGNSYGQNSAWKEAA